MRLLLPALVLAAACSTPSTRSVQGRLTGTTSQAVVFSETTAGDQTSTQVAPSGTFKLQVPVNRTVTLLVAEPQGGKLVVVRHIGPTWFQVRAGDLIELGTVTPEGQPAGSLEPVTEPPQTICPPSTTTGGRADLPYDAKLSLGQTWQLSDAFAEKGVQPARVVSVTMDGSSWRLAELQSGAAFTVTQADCDHSGNRDVGRDRAVITWQNADGSTETDHLDLRYCEAGSTSQNLEDPSSGDDGSECGEVEHEGCGDEGSSCDDSQLEPVPGSACPGN